MITKKTLYKIAITQAYKVGPITTRNLVSYCGGVEEVFKTKKQTLLKIPGVGEKTVDSLKDKEVLKKAEKELKLIEKHNIQVLFYTDSDFPKRLKHHQDCPTLLFYKGTANLNHPRIVGIVGTRKPENFSLSLMDIESPKHPYSISQSSRMKYYITSNQFPIASIS